MIGFLANSPEELIRLIGDKAEDDEAALIHRYFEMGLPPATSRAAISAMFGFNPGFVWSLLNRTSRYYREFEIPKGRDTRKIHAPRVVLKTIQKWLSIHFQNRWKTHDAVFGFVPGRSHIAAAAQHLGCTWVISVDIRDFFPSVTTVKVRTALENLGYVDEFSKDAITKLTCFRMGLAQGAPSSPVLSNIVLNDLDRNIAEYAQSLGHTYTRYADDIVLSGRTGSPENALQAIQELLKDDGWRIKESKTSIDRLPGRLKVHGLLVHGNHIRLTKGYRNRLRAYRHLLDNDKVKQTDLSFIRGHIAFANSVEKFSGE